VLVLLALVRLALVCLALVCLVLVRLVLVRLVLVLLALGGPAGARLAGLAGLPRGLAGRKHLLRHHRPQDFARGVEHIVLWRGDPAKAA